MSTLTATTTARAAKSKKPLSDVHQLQRAVRELQKEAADQLALEAESQATFEFLSSQVRALRGAFDTLSDVLLGELDALRKETRRALNESEAQVARQGEQLKDATREIAQLRRSLEVWALKERDWAKDNEILKASHAHQIEWMQQLQRETADVKDRLHAGTSTLGTRISELNEQANDFRAGWGAQVDEVLSKLHDADARAHKQELELRALGQARTNDMELMEQALATHGRQQQHANENGIERVDAAETKLTLLHKRLETLDAQGTEAKLAIEQMRTRNAAMEREQRRRMDSVGKMLAVSGWIEAYVDVQEAMFSS